VRGSINDDEHYQRGDSAILEDRSTPKFQEAEHLADSGRETTAFIGMRIGNGKIYQYGVSASGFTNDAR
jgi:hypothetical protein